MIHCYFIVIEFSQRFTMRRKKLMIPSSHFPRKRPIRAIAPELISHVLTGHENSVASSKHEIAINRPSRAGAEATSLRKLFLSRSILPFSLPLILYAECNEFRVLSRACGLTELTVAFSRRCTVCLLHRLLLFHFCRSSTPSARLHFYARSVASTALYTGNNEIASHLPFNL